VQFQPPQSEKQLRNTKSAQRIRLGRKNDTLKEHNFFWHGIFSGINRLIKRLNLAPASTTARK
jgi:hypothetical protein